MNAYGRSFAKSSMEKSQLVLVPDGRGHSASESSVSLTTVAVSATGSDEHMSEVSQSVLVTHGSDDVFQHRVQELPTEVLKVVRFLQSPQVQLDKLLVPDGDRLNLL